MSTIKTFEILIIPFLFLAYSGYKYLKTDKKIYLVSFVLLLIGVLGAVLLF